jgi:hypothetical protein
MNCISVDCHCRFAILCHICVALDQNNKTYCLSHWRQELVECYLCSMNILPSPEYRFKDTFCFDMYAKFMYSFNKIIWWHSILNCMKLRNSNIMECYLCSMNILPSPEYRFKDTFCFDMYAKFMYSFNKIIWWHSKVYEVTEQ